jgi:hypothetical protein
MGKILEKSTKLNEMVKKILKDTIKIEKRN